MTDIIAPITASAAPTTAPIVTTPAVSSTNASFGGAKDETASSIPDAPRRPARLHLDFLDGLRALAALVVIVDHAYSVLWYETAGSATAGSAYWLGFSQMIGHFAVTTFIALSGYCLMLPVALSGGLLKGGPLLFFKKRAKRILPPYYLALLLSLFLIVAFIGQRTGSHWDTSINVDEQGLATHALLIHNLFPHSEFQINNALWTVAVEWQIYFLFPALVWLHGRIGGAKATLAALACGYGLYLVVRYTSFVGLNAPYLGLFALGAWGASVTFHTAPAYVRLRERLPCGAIGTGVAAFIAAFSLHVGWHSAERRYAILDFLTAVCVVMLLISAGRSPSSPARRLLSGKPLVFLGTFAYSIYLIHVPIQQLFWQYTLRPLGLAPLPAFGLLLLTGTPVILGAAYLFFLACERPFMNTKPKQV